MHNCLILKIEKKRTEDWTQILLLHSTLLTIKLDSMSNNHAILDANSCIKIALYYFFCLHLSIRGYRLTIIDGYCGGRNNKGLNPDRKNLELFHDINQ